MAATTSGSPIDSPSSCATALSSFSTRIACNGRSALRDLLGVQVLEDRAEDVVGFLDLRQPLLGLRVGGLLRGGGLFAAAFFCLRFELGRVARPVGLGCGLFLLGRLVAAVCSWRLASTRPQVVPAMPATSSRTRPPPRTGPLFRLSELAQPIRALGGRASTGSSAR